MGHQNIHNHYGSRLDIVIDSSEIYDYEIAKTTNDYDADVLDFTLPITYDSCIFGTYPCYASGQYLPLQNLVATEITAGGCEYTIDQRTSLGWTLDFIFNRSGLTWSDGSVFYFLGLKDETNQKYYGDNNLSFKFGDSGEIIWSAYRYSGYCDSGYTEMYYVSSGETDSLCDDGTTDDFNITITFERNNEYTDCALLNEGGINDLMSGYTTGVSTTILYSEVLNSDWNDERDKRLGTLKIYFNGRPIYKLADWEEVIPSVRMSSNPMVQIWGSGTTGNGDLHIGGTRFEIKEINYYDEPLKFPEIYHNFIYRSDTYTFTTCDGCIDNLVPL